MDTLFQATQQILYGDKAACDDALTDIKETYPTFYSYLSKYWLSIQEFFVGHYRRGLLHIDNHTNNRLERCAPLCDSELHTNIFSAFD